MPVKPYYTIHKEHIHFEWNPAVPPTMAVAAGGVVEFETVDASGGQISADSGPEQVAAL